jgi:hypothetical protein
LDGSLSYWQLYPPSQYSLPLPKPLAKALRLLTGCYICGLAAGPAQHLALPGTAGTNALFIFPFSFIFILLEWPNRWVSFQQPIIFLFGI